MPELDQQQRELPVSIRIAAVVKAAGRRSQVERFQQGLDTLASVVEREGHAEVPRSHKTAEGLALGVWLNSTGPAGRSSPPSSSRRWRCSGWPGGARCCPGLMSEAVATLIGR